MKLLLSGGGTLGSVAPLLAIAETYRAAHPNAELLFVGTTYGPEQKVIADFGSMRFRSIASGKLRRYFSWRNFADPFIILFAFFQSLWLLRQERPDLLVSAGGYVSVPLHIAGWCLGIPTWIHQQDVELGLANRIMAWSATRVTVALEASTHFFRADKVEWLGNPVRVLAVPAFAAARQQFGIPLDATVLLVMGGGTGSERINELVDEMWSLLPSHIHLIHITGIGKMTGSGWHRVHSEPRYHAFELISDRAQMSAAYIAANVVVGRAGFGTLSELAALHKAVILLPMRHTHQEANARYLAERQAVMVANEQIKATELFHIIQSVLGAKAVAEQLGDRLAEELKIAPSERICALIDNLIHHKKETKNILS